MNFVFRTSRSIPIASAKVDAELLNRAYDEIAKALADGELVCIFPEGRITDHGDMYPFRSGIVRAIERSPVPVIPVALRGLWGSFFSRKDGAAMTRPFRRGILSKIGLAVGAPLPPQEVTLEKVQQLVLTLRGDRR